MIIGTEFLLKGLPGQVVYDALLTLQEEIKVLANEF